MQMLPRARTRQYPHQEHPLYDSRETLVDAARGSPLIRKKNLANRAGGSWRSTQREVVNIHFRVEPWLPLSLKSPFIPALHPSTPEAHA